MKVNKTYNCEFWGIMGDETFFCKFCVLSDYLRSVSAEQVAYLKFSRRSVAPLLFWLFLLLLFFIEEVKLNIKQSCCISGEWRPSGNNRQQQASLPVPNAAQSAIGARRQPGHDHCLHWRLLRGAAGGDQAVRAPWHPTYADWHQECTHLAALQGISHRHFQHFPWHPVRHYHRGGPRRLTWLLQVYKFTQNFFGCVQKLNAHNFAAILVKQKDCWRRMRPFIAYQHGMIRATSTQAKIQASFTGWKPCLG